MTIPSVIVKELPVRQDQTTSFQIVLLPIATKTIVICMKRSFTIWTPLYHHYTIIVPGICCKYLSVFIQVFIDNYLSFLQQRSIHIRRGYKFGHNFQQTAFGSSVYPADSDSMTQRLELRLWYVKVENLLRRLVQYVQTCVISLSWTKLQI